MSDVDTALTEGQRRFRAQTDVAGTYGTFTLGPDGAWTYTLHNTDEDTDALGAGEKETDTFAVASADGTTAQVMVTVTGADDEAVIGGDLAGAVTEDAQETGASGTLDVSDVDTALTGEQRRFNAQTDVAGRYGTFTLGPDGAWTYTLPNADPDTDALGAGQTGAERFAVFSTGGIRSEVVVTVTGSDDPAQIGGDLTGSVTEDDASAATASGTLTVSDPDSGERSFRISGGGRTVGRHGVFTLDADGEWTYTLDNASANALVTGQTVTERFVVFSTGGTRSAVVITVAGADDAAVIGGDSTGAVTEDDASAATASGTLTVSDPDANQSAFTAQTGEKGTYGTFTLSANGAWTYTLHNTDEDTDALGAGEKETDTFAVASADGTTAQVMVTVTGADDAAVIGGDLAGAVTEDAQETGASGTLAVSDVDTALTGEQRRFNAQTDVAGGTGRSRWGRTVRGRTRCTTRTRTPTRWVRGRRRRRRSRSRAWAAPPSTWWSR